MVCWLVSWAVILLFVVVVVVVNLLSLFLLLYFFFLLNIHGNESYRPTATERGKKEEKKRNFGSSLILHGLHSLWTVSTLVP